jgi:hypothetical protein
MHAQVAGGQKIQFCQADMACSQAPNVPAYVPVRTCSRKCGQRYILLLQKVKHCACVTDFNTSVFLSPVARTFPTHEARANRYVRSFAPRHARRALCAYMHLCIHMNTCSRNVGVTFREAIVRRFSSVAGWCPD